jgi:hypothetical protein
VIREKEQQLQQKNSMNSSRLKELENEIKTSRVSESMVKSYEDEVKKHK